jgi:hypothetical protein
MLFQAHPKAAEVGDYNRWLPLHHAIASNASSDIIEMLFQAYPEAVEVKKS